MPVNKSHLEFHRVDMTTGWSTPPGYPPGIEQKILAGELDEEARASRVGLYIHPAPVGEYDLLHDVEPESQTLTAAQLPLAPAEGVEQMR